MALRKVGSQMAPRRVTLPMASPYRWKTSIGPGGISMKQEETPEARSSRIGMEAEARGQGKPLTREEIDATSAGSTVLTSLGNLQEMVQGGATQPRGLAKKLKPIPFVGDVARYAQQKAVDAGVPWMVSKDPVGERMQSEITAMKANIPFTKGGKQLTKTEAKRIDVLLDTAGKSDDRINRDYQLFNDEFGIKLGLFESPSRSSIPRLTKNVGSKVKAFSSEEEALKSGFKGEAMINGRFADIS